MGENTVIVTICVVYFLVMIGTGIYASRKNKKKDLLISASQTLGFCASAGHSQSQSGRALLQSQA